MSTQSKDAPLVALQRGGVADLDGVMDVMTAAFESGFGEGWSRSQCAGILPLSGVVLTIARGERSRIVGFSLQRTIADESELLLLAVHRSAQRCGVGGQLVDHFVDTSRAAGATRLHLEVRDGNVAITMYRAFGFVAAGRRTAYYRGSDGRLFDAVTMALDLSRD